MPFRFGRYKIIEFNVFFLFVFFFLSVNQFQFPRNLRFLLLVCQSLSRLLSRSVAQLADLLLIKTIKWSTDKLKFILIPGLGYGDRSFSWTWLWRSWVNAGFGGLLTEGLVLGQICYTAYLGFFFLYIYLRSVNGVRVIRGFKKI